MIAEERSAGIYRVAYPGVSIDRVRGILTSIMCRKIFHKPIIHILPENINHFFSFNQTGINHRLTQVIKIKEICGFKKNRRIIMTKTFRLTNDFKAEIKEYIQGGWFLIINCQLLMTNY